ncbi:MAG: DNA mismatch repair endonuclease MutL [Bacillota bacterium]|nr:DNA mismatch repair endonuclease MutL [Bacillota bacterium]
MIKVLEKSIADKIAAGEVIDRPVSIIKELLENSIDAGADTITVEIKNGGKTYIRVTDNGCGIDSDQVETAFLRHATSKIDNVKDLDSIRTLGFRGEALASIAAVSRVELITCTADSKAGRKVVIEGSQVIQNIQTGCPQGTTITVRDLFYNVPARRKFLSSDNAEARKITELVSRMALAYSDIRINLINGSKRVFSTQGKGNIFNNIISIYGSDTGRDLIPIEAESYGFLLKGFISSPAATVPTRNKEIFCVNGRVISSRIIQEGLEQAYDEKLFGGRFPIAFLFLFVPPEKIDVNIHPTKKEIRFDDDFEVKDFITKAASRALNSINAVPKARSEHISQPIFRPADKQYENKVAENVNEYEFQREKDEEKVTEEQVDINNILETMRKSQQSVKATAEEIERETAEEVNATAANNPFDFDSLSIIGSVFNTYILASDGQSFFMIDQHAAHERIFYEKFMNQYNSQDKLCQQLLIPINIGASAQVVSREEEWMELLKKAGYDIEFFGNNRYIIREIPAFMSMDEGESFVRDMFEEFDTKPDLKSKTAVDRIITKSCKSAVKAGDILKPEEITALIDQLKDCRNPFSCPHGRPTFIRITKYEIEKMFKRV